MSIASKSKFDYPPDYYVVHHEMEAMSEVLERIRDIRNMHQDKVILKRPPGYRWIKKEWVKI